MSVKHSLLAILNLGDCHGYQLRHELESRTGDTWPINVGQIYSTLERLERDGLVSASNVNADGQIRYSITANGRNEAARWLTSPVERTQQNRDELAMKLALAVTLPGVDVERILSVQRLAALQNLQLLTTAKKNSDENQASDLAWILVIDSQIFSAKQERSSRP
jgi:DNA-binding PadR family transcriptional regulator